MNLSVERILYLADKYPEIIITLDELAQKTNKIQDPPLTLVEACDFLHYTSNFVYKLYNRNLILYHKPNGKSLFFYKSELNDWICRRSEYTIEELAKIRHYAVATQPPVEIGKQARIDKYFRS